MKSKLQVKPRIATLKVPDGNGRSMLAGSPFDQRGTLAEMGVKTGEDITRHWFNMKFYDDLSDLRLENRSYYKHYVHHFVDQWFSEERIANKRILDFGCGPGFYSAILAQRGAIVTGIDLSAFLIDKANQHKARLGLKNVEFVQTDFITYASRMAAKQFDYVLAIDTLVSFDYDRKTHDHERVSRAFSSIARVMKDDGRCFIIESHPFFGQVFHEIPSGAGEYVCLRSPHYKIEYKLKSDIHHWFTLEEMTKATSENGLAILCIHEPDPSIDFKHENAEGYSFRLKYPAMIVYEMCKLRTRTGPISGSE
jgi:SAM-dependent methyltransferase